MYILRRLKRAMTIPELTLVIIVLGIAVTTLVALLGEVAKRGAFSEAIATATFYAQEKMERVRSKDFSGVDSLAGTDYPASGYERVVAVGYCRLSGSDWVSSVSVTEYKMATVTVSRTDGFIPSVSLATIMSEYTD